MLIVALSLAGIALGLAILAAVTHAARSAATQQPRPPRVTEIGPDGALRIRTSRGPATARIVISDQHGRAYEIVSRLRGEGKRTTYVPPTIQNVVRHLSRRLAD